MIDNPSELPYAEGVYENITLKCRRLNSKFWEVSCPEWKCTLHDRNLTRCVAVLLAEIEQHNDQWDYEDCEQTQGSFNRTT